MTNKSNTAVLDAPPAPPPVLEEPIIGGLHHAPKPAPKKVKQPSVAELVDWFLTELAGDAEAKILLLDQFGKPNRWDAFQHVPHNCQRIVTLRVLIVDEPRQ